MIPKQTALIALIPFALSANDTANRLLSGIESAKERIAQSSPFQRLSLGASVLTSLAVKGIKDGAILCRAGKPGAAYAILSGKLATLGAFALGSNAQKAYNEETDRTFAHNVAQGTALTVGSILMPSGQKLSPAAKHSFARNGINFLKRTALGSSKRALFGYGVNALSQGTLGDEARKAYDAGKPYAVTALDAAKELVHKIDCGDLG